MEERKIAIMTDSSSTLDYMDHDYNEIFITRLTISFSDDEYVDGETISNTEFFDRLTSEDVIPTSSQPSIGNIAKLFETIRDEGYTDIIFLPLSKGISGTYQSSFAAKDLVDGIDIHIVDTKCTSVYLGFMAMEAARLAREGKSVEEIITVCDKHAEQYEVIFMVEDLRYLVKNGRLSNAAGFLGGILKIKPMLEFDEEGKIVGREKKRTTKKALKYLVDQIIERTKGYKKVQYLVTYGLDKDLKEKFDEELERVKPLGNIMDAPLPSVIGCHVGNSVVSLGYFVVE
ncbi:DegV family protein [Haloplasma contractile]|uniref:DegV family protein n=1 Tax=Haloplasma contractile SSD-17B TaxID=1033810 RepID=U2FEQ5_9MOLU|nr:DegV family protein [Haloplasma contractile]ERJ11430.1 DegV family protein [Haloplasma contractile SSD-17B]